MLSDGSKTRLLGLLALNALPVPSDVLPPNSILVWPGFVYSVCEKGPPKIGIQFLSVHELALL